MDLLETREARLALSLALGLLLGVERERRKRERGHDAIAGLRTFGITGLLGGLASYVEVPYLVVTGALILGALISVGYALDPDGARDRGLTTELSLLLTYLLGTLSLTRPDVAGTAAIGTALLLYFRTSLHRFVRDALRENELHDGLLLLVFAFVVLPLAPDLNLGPYHAVNPQRLARLMLVVTLVSSAGYVAQRLFGARSGLVASGFASGFVSSSATIAALGLRAKQDPSIVRAAAAGALASSIATVVQYAVVVATIDVGLLMPLAPPLGFALVASVLATLLFARSSHSGAQPADAPSGRAFQIWPALAVGGGSAVVAIAAAGLAKQIGDAGIVLVSAVSGFVDAHSTAASVAGLHRAEQLETHAALLALLCALSSNTITKIVMAFLSGARAYALLVAGGVVGIALCAWLGFLISSPW